MECQNNNNKSNTVENLKEKDSWNEYDNLLNKNNLKDKNSNMLKNYVILFF